MSKILFKVNDNGNIINVEYSGEITCKEFMADFFQKHTNYSTVDPYTFLINSEVLNSPMFMNKQLKDLICNDQVVQLFAKRSGSGDICFHVSDQGRIINVKYSGDITCKEFILDFTKNHTNYATTDSTMYTFRAGGKILNTPKFMQMKLIDLIRDGSTVTFTRKEDMFYG
jgi:hypothetical protein